MIQYSRYYTIYTKWDGERFQEVIIEEVYKKTERKQTRIKKIKRNQYERTGSEGKEEEKWTLNMHNT